VFWADHLSRKFLPNVCVCVFECYREASTLRKPWPIMGCRSREKKHSYSKWALIPWERNTRILPSEAVTFQNSIV
jgi:hypothetical protein